MTECCADKYEFVRTDEKSPEEVLRHEHHPRLCIDNRRIPRFVDLGVLTTATGLVGYA
jgi:hypothetical protein